MTRFALVLVLVFAQAVAGCSAGGDDASFKRTRSLASQGDAEAQNRLGLMYAEGEVVDQNYAEAALWFRRAATQGHTESQHNLGLLYKSGQGVPYDLDEAARWTQLAASQGDPLAQYNLGILYHNGEGVDQNDVLAHMWIDLAAARLPPGEVRDSVIISRDQIARLMSLSQVLEAQRLAKAWRPSTP